MNSGIYLALFLLAVTPIRAAKEATPECENNCMEEGDCQAYKYCEGEKWQHEQCDAETWWNNATNDHGGSCDFWANLSQELQDKYRDSDDCPVPPLDCYWRPDADCDNKYYWLPENQRNNKTEQAVFCPESGEVSLVWSQEKLTCVHCVGECNICDGDASVPAR